MKLPVIYTDSFRARYLYEIPVPTGEMTIL